MLKMTIDNEEVLSNNDISIKEEILSPSSTILNNVYPKSWEEDKDYVSRFYYPKDYSKLNIQNFSTQPEEAGTTIQINGSATLTDVDTSKESRVLRLLGQTSQNGTPTPDAPIPVNVVSGDNTIDICGKNLFNKNNDGIVTNKGINLDGTLFNSSVSSVTNYIKVNPNTTYTFSGGNDATHTKRVVMFSTTDLPSVSAIGQANTKITFTTTNDTNYIRIQFKTSEIDTMQLEVGSTATTYEPYIGNTYEINLGKNLIDINNVSTTASANWGISVSGNDLIIEHKRSYTSGVPNFNLGVLKAGTYVFSGTLPTGSSVGLYIDDTYKTNLNSSNPTFIADGTSNYNLKFGNNEVSTKTYSNLMLEKGSQATSYSPYFTPIELCKIGTYQDYIYKEDGSWYVHKEIGKVVLDGSENAWTKYSALDTTNYFCYYLPLNTLYVDSTGAIQLCLSNYFTGVSFNNKGTDTANMWVSKFAKQLYLKIQNTITTVAELQTWLSTHNTTVYYVLATPTNTLIEDTTLIEQLEALSS